VVVHCRRLAEDIITAAGAVMMDKTGWSCPISAALQAALKTTRSVALQGYATAQDRVTSVLHAVQPPWYCLDL
jgi:hypothetical protein